MDKTNKVMSILKITTGVTLLFLIHFHLHRICLYWEVRPYMYALEITTKFRSILGMDLDAKIVHIVLIVVGYFVIPVSLFSYFPHSKVRYSYFTLSIWAAFYYGYVKYVLFAQRISGGIAMKTYGQFANYSILANRLIITPLLVIVSIVLIVSYAKRGNESSIG